MKFLELEELVNNRGRMRWSFINFTFNLFDEVEEIWIYKV